MRREKTSNQDIPVVRQTSPDGCAAAALFMVLRFFGHDCSLTVLEEQLSISPKGVSASKILEVAAQHSLEGCGVIVPIEHLGSLAPGSILHWDQRHYVVLESAHERGITIIDPAVGRKALTIYQLERHFSGSALLFHQVLKER
jgi:ATP-binding cassette, subfamily B, bacterial